MKPAKTMTAATASQEGAIRRNFFQFLNHASAAAGSGRTSRAILFCFSTTGSPSASAARNRSGRAATDSFDRTATRRNPQQTASQAGLSDSGLLCFIQASRLARPAATASRSFSPEPGATMSTWTGCTAKRRDAAPAAPEADPAERRAAYPARTAPAWSSRLTMWNGRGEAPAGSAMSR